MALRLCSRQLPDCIVLDYLLADRDGLQILNELKTYTGVKCPPIIMLNERGNEAIAIRAFKTGVEDYLIENEITPESFCYVTRTAIENFRLRQRLRASEERYRAIVEDQTELICRFLSDCTLTFVNRAYSRYFDSTPEQLIGQNFLDLIPESHHNCVRQQIAELSALTPENAVITHEHPVIKPNGEIGWQQWTNRAIFNSDGELVELQAVGRDISERKQTEIALQKANERFEIAAAVNCLIYDYDLQQNTIYRSQGLTQLFGYSPREIEPTAEWWYERIHPSQREAIQEVKRLTEIGQVSGDLNRLQQIMVNLLTKVSDIAMPDINGHELLQQIRRIYPERQIPAIALTAYTSSSDRDYALRVGFEKYFSKPIEPEVLVQAIVNLQKGNSE